MALATLSIDIVAKLATLEQNMKQATDVVTRSTKLMENAFDGARESIKHLIEGVVSFETVKFGLELIKSSIETQAHLVALSASLQIAVEDVGALGFAMKQSGGDTASMEAAIAKLNVAIGKALNGDDKASAPFKAMGIELKNTRGEVISTESALLQLSEKFSSYADNARKTALAQAELGRGYKEMLVFLDQGPAEIQRQIDFFKEWSGVTGESAERAHDLEKAFGQLSVMTHGMVNQFVNQLEPTLTALVSSWIDNKTQGDNFKSVIEEIGPAFAQMAIDILESVRIGTASMAQLLDSGQRIQNFFRIVGDPRNFNWKGTLGDFFQSMHQQFDDANKQLDVQGAIADDRVRKLQGVIERAQQAVRAANTSASALSSTDFFQTIGAARLNQRSGDERPDAPGLPDAAKINEVAKAIEAMNKRLAEMAVQVTRQEDPWHTLHRVQAEIANDPKLLAAPKLIRDAWEASAIDIDRTIQAHQRLAETERFVQQQEETLTKTLNEETEAFLRLRDATPVREIFLLGLETDKLTAQFEHGTKSAEDLLAQVLQLNRVRLPEDDSNVLVSREGAIRRAFAAVAEAQGDSVELQRKLNVAITQLYGLPATPPPAIDAIHVELLKLSDTVNQTLGDGLTSALEGRFADIGRAFRRMIEQMIVQVTQADLMDRLFGQSLGGARQGGGWLDALFGFGSNLISGSSGGTSGAIAGGGAGSAGDWFAAGPSAAPISNTFNIASGVSRSELIALVPTMTQQVTASVMQTMRRPGFSGG